MWLTLAIGWVSPGGSGFVPRRGGSSSTPSSSRSCQWGKQCRFSQRLWSHVTHWAIARKRKPFRGRIVHVLDRMVWDQGIWPQGSQRIWPQGSPGKVKKTEWLAMSLYHLVRLGHASLPHRSVSWKPKITSIFIIPRPAQTARWSCYCQSCHVLRCGNVQLQTGFSEHCPSIDDHPKRPRKVRSSLSVTEKFPSRETDKDDDDVETLATFFASFGETDSTVVWFYHWPDQSRLVGEKLPQW